MSHKIIKEDINKLIEANEGDKIDETTIELGEAILNKMNRMKLDESYRELHRLLLQMQISMMQKKRLK